jgi:deoxycytidine triphosphate deaminase
MHSLVMSALGSIDAGFSGSRSARSRTIQRSQTLLDRKDLFVELLYRRANVKPAVRLYFKAASHLLVMLPESF